MKLTAPKSADEYFQETEHAVKHAYAGLDSCWAYAQEALLYETPGVERDGMVHYSPPTTPEEKAKLTRSLELLRQYQKLRRFSEATFAGSILQTAYMAIKLCSPRKTLIPASCAAVVKPSTTESQFCIGSERFGVPTGLIVYAGRNQYAHWDEAQLNKVNEWVFARLSEGFSDDPFSDLAFDLGNPTINIYAGEVLLTALGWHSYDTYLAEMKRLLS